MELRHPQNKRTKCFSSVPAQVYRVFEEEDTRLTRLGDSISSVLRKELGSRITGRTNLMVRQTFENQQEAAGIWMGFWSFFLGGWDGCWRWVSILWNNLDVLFETKNYSDHSLDS